MSFEAWIQVPRLPSDDSNDGRLDARSHDSRRGRKSAAETRLELENRILRKRLELLTGSPGWRLIAGYRRRLRQIAPGRLPRKILDRLAAYVSNQPLNSVAVPCDELQGFGLDGINEAIIHESLLGGDTLVVCDSPHERSTRPLVGTVQVSGWAVSKPGIRSIDATIDGGPKMPVRFGDRRADVGMHLPEYPASSDSGFLFDLDCTNYASGTHRLAITAHSTDGRRTTLVRTIRTDSSPPYQVWIERNETPEGNADDARQDVDRAAGQEPLLVVLFVESDQVGLLQKQLKSIVSQSHQNYELLVIAPPEARDQAENTLDLPARNDARIAHRWIDSNDAAEGALSAAIEQSAAGLVAYLYGAILAPGALSEIARAAGKQETVDLFYGDDDRILADGQRQDPFFKPQFSPDLLNSYNYIGAFFVARRAVALAVAEVCEGAEFDHAYAMVLRFAEQTPRIERIPKVLSHRIGPPVDDARSAAEKQGASDRARAALEAHLRRIAAPATVQAINSSSFHVRYQLESTPRISIVIPTGGKVDRLRVAIASVIERTDYPEYRIVVVDNSSDDRVQQYLARFASADRVQSLDCRSEPFNFSRLCNSAARGTQSPLLLFLNDDVEVLSRDWLNAMAEFAVQPGVGAVGARLLYPDGTIQHGGVVIGVRGLVGGAFRGLTGGHNGYLDLSAVTRNCAAVTAACLMTRRDVFEELNGFDEVNLQISLQDVDYCLRAIEKGYRVVYTPNAELTHYESLSRQDAGLLTHPHETLYMRKRWADWMEDDPYYSPHLTRLSEDFSIRLED